MSLTIKSDPSQQKALDSLRSRVFKLIKMRSFSRGCYTLSSGEKSDFYLDMKPSMFDPQGANDLSSMILSELEALKVDYIGGLELGAVPLISTTTMLSDIRHKPIPGFFVRKEIKGHGTRKLVEGLTNEESLSGKRVVILDDVTTSGRSAMIAVKTAQNEGASVILVLAVVDREEGASEFYKKAGIPFRSLFRASEFMAS